MKIERELAAKTSGSHTLMSIDLHIHSSFSDGSMTPAEIVQMARQRKLSAIAITDHDTTEGVDEAIEAGSREGLTVVSGIELSVKFGAATLHLLGYLLDHRHPDFLQALHSLQEGRLTRNRRILDALRQQGIPIELDELLRTAGHGQSGRPHIAQILIDKGVVRSMDEAFACFLGEGGSAYVPRFIFPAVEAISLIHRAGGLAVLAHPQQLGRSGGNFARIIADLHRQGLDGVEVYYPTHSRQFRKALLRLAQQHDLLRTGGSDFHGAIRPGTTMAGGKSCHVPDQLLVEMHERLARLQKMPISELSH